MNIKAIWTYNDYTTVKTEVVTIISIEWINGKPAAWCINKNGQIYFRYLSNLRVIDKKYLPIEE
jgi:hypothetical protein